MVTQHISSKTIPGPSAAIPVVYIILPAGSSYNRPLDMVWEAFKVQEHGKPNNTKPRKHPRYNKHLRSISQDDGKLQQGNRYTHKNIARSMDGETRILRTIKRPSMRSKQEYRYTGPRNPHDQLGNNSVILPNNRKKPTHTSGRILQIRNPRHQKRNKALKHGIYYPQCTEHPNPTPTF